MTSEHGPTVTGVDHYQALVRQTLTSLTDSGSCLTGIYHELFSSEKKALSDSEVSQSAPIATVCFVLLLYDTA